MSENPEKIENLLKIPNRMVITDILATLSDKDMIVIK
jgi:hypothetical protein